MSQPFDLSRFPDLPPEVAKAFGAVQFQFSVERAARLHEQAVVAEKEAFITELKALIDRLEDQVQDYRRTKFGPKSEKLDPAQLDLALEDLETAVAETQARIAAVEDRIPASEPDPEKRQPRAPCKTRVLPESLPRDLRMIEPDTIVWSPLLRHWSERQWRRGCGDMVRIGEDRTERGTEVKRQIKGGRSYVKSTHRVGQGRPLVEHWLIEGSGHAWSGGSPAERFVDPTGPDASREMVRFFLRHRKSIRKGAFRLG
jgi:hypothetical protein